MAVTLRIGKNQSAWEDGTVDELLKLAFCKKTGEPDLSLSVYLVEPSRIDQARVEHLASETLPLITITTSDLDLSDLAEPVPTPGRTAFKFTRDEAHAEFHLESEKQLREIIEKVKSEPSRRLRRDRDALMAYIVAREADGDPEWLALLARPEKAKWRELVDKLKNKKKLSPAPR